MKKILLLSFVFITFSQLTAQQANLYTIPNQSAHFVRMPSRHASTEIDAVFFNPAATTKLENGFHLSVNNQILNQITNIESSYVFYNENPQVYPGRVTGFFFPSFFLAYNINKVSFHGSFMMIGGTGGVEYNNLPISDRGIADIPEVLRHSFLIAMDNKVFDQTGVNPMYSHITDYHFGFRNKGLGYSPGLQGGMAYEVNKYFSFSVDFRLSRQVISSEGFVKDIQIYNEFHGGWQRASTLLRTVAAEQNESGYNTIANIYDDLSGDRLINITQRGGGITPIVGFSITPTDKLNIGLKYEHKTRTVLTTKVINNADGGGVFTDKEEIRSDLPGFLAMGLGYQITENLRVHTGARVFFSKNVNLNGREQYIEGNNFEIESALEYKISEKFFLSGGYTYTRPNVNILYQNDVDFVLPGHTGAIGFKWRATEEVAFNVGGMYTKFVPLSTTMPHNYADGNPLATVPPDYTPEYDITYDKTAFIIAIGVDFKFAKNSKNNGNGSSANASTPYYYRAQ
jgi:long-chain fatty acid transport protein